MNVKSVDSKFTVELDQQEICTLLAAVFTLKDRVSDISEPVVEMNFSTSTGKIGDDIGTDATIGVSKSDIRQIHHILLELWKNQKLDINT